MNIFQPFTLQWWQVALFKIALISLGIILGASWPQAFTSLMIVIWLLFIVPALYIAYVWWKQ